jgi:hypothetical protein
MSRDIFNEGHGFRDTWSKGDQRMTKDDPASWSKVRESDALAGAMGALLAGRDPDVNGAAIGEVCATFVAGHHPKMRSEAIAMLLELIDKLVPFIVEQMIAEGKAPEDWRA